MTIPRLFQGLCDDAALFPPGNAPLQTALTQHALYRDSEYAGIVGPFVFPLTRLHELSDLHEPIALSLTVAGGPDAASAGLELARSIPGLTVSAIEVALPTGSSVNSLRDMDDSIDTYVEIPRDGRRDATFDLVEDLGYRAKLRTGGVTADAYPDEAELAAQIFEAVHRGIPFKATAGLHRAVRNTSPTSGFEQHGYLNLLLAAQSAAAGTTPQEIEKILALRDDKAVSAEVGSVHAERVFESFGTCSIREPLDDLISLGLIPPRQPEIRHEAGPSFRSSTR